MIERFQGKQQITLTQKGKEFISIARNWVSLKENTDIWIRVLLNIDSTLFNTYGNQEGEAFNNHYSNHGYHPLLYYDGLIGDLLKSELLNGNVYTSDGTVPFIEPLLFEYMDPYLNTDVYLRGDIGFAVPCHKAEG